MQLTATEKYKILEQLCKAHGTTAAGMSHTLDMAKSRNIRQSVRAAAEADSFVAQFNILCKAAAERKEAMRSDKSLSKLRRLVEESSREGLKKALREIGIK